MTLPNILTVSRIVLAAGFIYSLSRMNAMATMLAIVLFTLASLTDFYDGYFAKKYNMVTDFGKIMDPIADKVLILIAFYFFMDLQLVAAWMFYVILVREVAVTGSRLWAITKGKVLAAEQAGKVKTVSQIVAISAILLFILFQQMEISAYWPDAVFTGWALAIYVLMLVTVCLTAISGISYFWMNKDIVLFGKST